MADRDRLRFFACFRMEFMAICCRNRDKFLRYSSTFLHWPPADWWSSLLAFSVHGGRHLSAWGCLDDFSSWRQSPWRMTKDFSASWKHVHYGRALIAGLRFDCVSDFPVAKHYTNSPRCFRPVSFRKTGADITFGAGSAVCLKRLLFQHMLQVVRTRIRPRPE